MEPLASDSYGQFLAEMKSRIQAAQLRASLAVNRELVLLYWQIGRDILDRQEREKWGAKVIDRLAADLKRSFPDMKGLSPRNLKYMRAFAEAWREEPDCASSACTNHPDLGLDRAVSGTFSFVCDRSDVRRATARLCSNGRNDHRCAAGV